MATYATKCNKQVKPALQQTASPPLQQQIEPKKPKMLQRFGRFYKGTNGTNADTITPYHNLLV